MGFWCRVLGHRLAFAGEKRCPKGVGYCGVPMFECIRKGCDYTEAIDTSCQYCQVKPAEELHDRARPTTKEEYLITMMAMMLGEDIEIDGHKVRSLECFKAQQILFLAMKHLESEGMKLNIPYYWSTHGVRIELNTLVKRFPKIKWTCLKHEFENCPYKAECDFIGKYRG